MALRIGCTLSRDCEEGDVWGIGGGSEVPGELPGRSTTACLPSLSLVQFEFGVQPVRVCVLRATSAWSTFVIYSRLTSIRRRPLTVSVFPSSCIQNAVTGSDFGNVSNLHQFVASRTILASFWVWSVWSLVENDCSIRTKFHGIDIDCTVLCSYIKSILDCDFFKVRMIHCDA